VGRILQGWGHEVCFIAFSQDHQRKSELPIIPYAEAAQQTWDAVMLAGGGWCDQRLQEMVKPQFGTRIQHILSDQSKRDDFFACNGFFRPHVVIFNNRHWNPGSFTDFGGDAFYYLEGAVDSELMKPAGKRNRNGKFILGGQLAKTPEPIIDTVRAAGGDLAAHLFGQARLNKEWSALVKSGELKLAGQLEDRALPDFYHGVDCVVHAEMKAGWANLVAEAMACGIPVVCTRAGTLALAEHERTALIIEEPTAKCIGEAIARLRSDPALGQRLASAAREHVLQFSWPHYAERLIEMIKTPERSYYYHAPELGLHGKWPVARRLNGLDALLSVCGGMSVLDLGCAEGVIARAFLDAGAGLIHGFDIDEERAGSAAALCGDTRAQIRAGNLEDWAAFVARHGDMLLPAYDVVLYLGLHQHLKAATRMATLTGAASRAKEWFAIRTPETVMQSDGIRAALVGLGFDLHHEQGGVVRMGPVMLFKRRSPE
jgi:hypothetical protein